MNESLHAQPQSPPPLPHPGKGESRAAARRAPGEDARLTKRSVAAATLVPASTRAETAMPTPRNVIPDGCNMGTLLRVAVGVNIAAFVLALALARNDVFAGFL